MSHRFRHMPRLRSRAGKSKIRGYPSQCGQGLCNAMWFPNPRFRVWWWRPRSLPTFSGFNSNRRNRLFYDVLPGRRQAPMTRLFSRVRKWRGLRSGLSRCSVTGCSQWRGCSVAGLSSRFANDGGLAMTGASVGGIVSSRSQWRGVGWISFPAKSDTLFRLRSWNYFHGHQFCLWTSRCRWWLGFQRLHVCQRPGGRAWISNDRKICKRTVRNGDSASPSPDPPALAMQYLCESRCMAEQAGSSRFAIERYIKDSPSSEYRKFSGSIVPRLAPCDFTLCILILNT